LVAAAPCCHAELARQWEGCVPSTDRLQPRRGRSGMTLSGMVTSRL
jgi:hypothetical protein